MRCECIHLNSETSVELKKTTTTAHDRNTRLYLISLRSFVTSDTNNSNETYNIANCNRESQQLLANYCDYFVNVVLLYKMGYILS